MTQAETRTIGYGIAASLALHIAVFVMVGISMSMSTIRKLAQLTPEPEKEPEVTLVYASNFEVVPPPPPPKPVPVQKEERYIRTTQNVESDKAPEKADFISDKNTVASAKLPSTPGGDPTMPTLSGVDVPTRELANRDFKAGETKRDSALATKPVPPTPAVKPTPPPPQVAEVKPPAPQPPPVEKPKPKPEPLPEIAKKDASPTEKMMQELDEKLKEDAKERLPLELRRPPEDKPEPPKKADEPPPEMKAPDQLPVLKAEPVPEPVANTHRPEKDAFQPQTRVAKTPGAIDTPGAEDAVNSMATPKGRYMRQVTSAIEKKWHYLSRERTDSVQPGRLRVLFRVNKNGKIKPEDVKILYNKANPLLTDLTISAILEAQISPIPKELLPMLDQERVEIEYEFVIY